jgi:hypothetical protein
MVHGCDLANVETMGVNPGDPSPRLEPLAIGFYLQSGARKMLFLRQRGAYHMRHERHSGLTDLRAAADSPASRNPRPPHCGRRSRGHRADKQESS